MITYVNTVFVGNGKDAVLTAEPTKLTSNVPSAQAGSYIMMDVDNGSYSVSADTKRFKIGYVTKKNVVTIDPATKVVKYSPIVKWSNIINKDAIKSYNKLTYAADTEDSIAIDFSAASMAELTKGNRRVVVRLTFKDLPTRFRKWTESYEYVTEVGETTATLASNLAVLINKEYKRARVVASASGAVLTITAMPYDDDNAVDTINWAEKVRFSANVYYTDPTAPAFTSKNKYTIDGATITKTPGKYYAASAKLVRDRESQAMGYEGILNRGCCTWPIIKPDMQVDLSAHYDAITLEFENMYRAADDIFRKNKQSVEIYDVTGKLTNLIGKLDLIVEGPKNSGASAGEENKG